MSARWQGWWRPAAAYAVTAALLGPAFAGCAVPTQDTATAVDVQGLGPSGDDAVPVETAGLATVWFVQDDHLVPMQVPAPGASVSDLLTLLASGPPQGSPASIRSLVGDPAHGGSLVVIPPTDPEQTATPSGEVTVAVTESFGSLPAEEQVLLLAQVVTTLGSAGAQSVLVTDPQGVPLAVPLPDGRLLDRPPRPSDYATLVG